MDPSLQGVVLADAQVETEMIARLDAAFDLVTARAAARSITCRQAALYIGIERVLDAHRTRGLYP